MPASPFRQPRRRAPALLAVLLAGAAVLTAPAHQSIVDAAATPAAPGPAAGAAGTDLVQRIAYAGTDHRGIGRIEGTGAQATAPALLGEAPAHFDDEVSARGAAVTWVSRRATTSTEVYLRGADGVVRRVTDNAVDESHPVLSPGGGRIAYASAGPRTDGGCDIYLSDVDGGGLHRLTDGSGDNTWPTWSADGTALAFARSVGGGAAQIYRIPAAGGTPIQLTGEPTGAAEPAWDPVPGHDRLAYTTDPGDGGGPQIRLVAATGGAGMALLPAGWQSRQAAWSADGSTVAFISATTPDGAGADRVDRVYSVVVQPDPCLCQVQLRLAEDRAPTHPTWYDPAGDGTEVLLVARSSGAQRATVTLQDVRPDGTDPRDLGLAIMREDPGARDDSLLLFEPVDGDPWFERQAYSPDGQTIAVTRFETVDGQRTERLWLVGADGSNPRLLPVAGRGPGDRETDPAWSPDGTRIALVRDSPQPGSDPPQRTVSRIEVVEVSSGARLLDLPVPAGLEGYDDTQPAWSPDGATLAFSRGDYRDRELVHVWTANAADGQNQVDLSQAVCGGECAVFDDSAAFSPGGGQLAFNREQDGLLLTNVDGTGCRMLLPATGASCAAPVPPGGDGPFQPRDVAWSPDGTQLAFSARREAGANSPEALNVYDLASGAIRPLTTGLAGRQKEPAWQRLTDVATSLGTAADPTTVGGLTTLRVTVTDQGPSAAGQVRLRLSVPPQLVVTGLTPTAGSCDLAELTCAPGPIGVGRAVEVRVDLVGTEAGTFTVGWSVSSAPPDADPTDNSAETLVRVDPAPPGSPPDPTLTVTVTPRPGYVGGTVIVTYTARNAGGSTATGLLVRPGLPDGVPVRSHPAGCASGTDCPVPDLVPGAATMLSFTLAPTRALTAAVTGTVATTGGDADPTNDTARTELRVLQPRIEVLPALGPPGFVPIVRGIDFPPGARVRLAWSAGITAAAAPAVPGAGGRFTAGLLVLPKDELGPREVIASGPGFSPVRAEFLVVQPAQQPPGLLQRGW